MTLNETAGALELLSAYLNVLNNVEAGIYSFLLFISDERSFANLEEKYYKVFKEEFQHLEDLELIIRIPAKGEGVLFFVRRYEDLKD